MTVFDLVFICVFLGSVVSLIATLINAFRGRRKAAQKTAKVLSVVLGVYLAITALVAIISPQKVLTRGQSRCFDEMCFTVSDVTQCQTVGTRSHNTSTAHGSFYLVTIDVSCRGHGRAQSEGGVGASLVDTTGHTYEASVIGQRDYDAAHVSNLPLTARVTPGDTVPCVLVFDVPSDAKDVSLHVSHSGPGLFIIGDDESPLHKPTIIRLN